MIALQKQRQKKIISAPSFRLEGSGWYETDFKTGNKKNLVQSDIKSKKPSKEPKKTENSKPAKKRLNNLSKYGTYSNKKYF